MKKTEDIKTQVKAIATGLGVEEALADQIAIKCYDEVYWRPYGGATSFAEIDANEKAREFAYKVDDETYKFRAIVDNVVNGAEKPDGKVDVSLIKKAADEYQSRIDSINIEEKSIFTKLKELFTGHKEEEPEAEESGEVVVLGKGSIKLFKDKSGATRWLATSSNAFEDLEKELFTTEALQEAIEHAEVEDARGPLMFLHIPGTEMGKCDFQAMAGRFLIESGTFDDTPLGRKAIEVFSNTDEELQVSIGYTYLEGDEADGVYDWLRFRERSICPPGTAANPYTSFKITGDVDMDAAHKAWMEKYFGKELTEETIGQAETKTKELEAAGVRFKSFDIEGFAAEYAKTTGADPEKAALIAKKMAEEFAPKAEEVETTTATANEEKPADDEKSKQLMEFLTDISEQISSIKEIVQKQDEAIKELQLSDDEKVAREMAPRYQVTSGNRPTESQKNVSTDEKVLESVKTQGEDQSAARDWANVLMGAKN